MSNSDIEVLFPPRVIHLLQNLRDEAWRNLVTEILSCAPGDPRRLAFEMTMIRVCGCQTCHADTFRAMRGCLSCATQTVKRTRSSDKDLQLSYQDALREVERYLSELEVEK